jgi:hypothetical protein
LTTHDPTGNVTWTSVDHADVGVVFALRKSFPELNLKLATAPVPPAPNEFTATTEATTAPRTTRPNTRPFLFIKTSPLPLVPNQRNECLLAGPLRTRDTGRKRVNDSLTMFNGHPKASGDVDRDATPGTP